MRRVLQTLIPTGKANLRAPLRYPPVNRSHSSSTLFSHRWRAARLIQAAGSQWGGGVCAQIQSCGICIGPGGSLGVVGLRAYRLLGWRERRSAAAWGSRRVSAGSGLCVDGMILQLGRFQLEWATGAMGAATPSGVCLAKTHLRALPQRLEYASRTLGAPLTRFFAREWRVKIVRP